MDKKFYWERFLGSLMLQEGSVQTFPVLQVLQLFSQPCKSQLQLGEKSTESACKTYLFTIFFRTHTRFPSFIFLKSQTCKFYSWSYRETFPVLQVLQLFLQPCKSYHYSCSWQINPRTQLVKHIFLQFFWHCLRFSFLYFFSPKLVSFIAGVIRKHFRCCKFYNFSCSLVNLTTIVVVGR